MKNKLLFLLVALFTLISCSKSEDALTPEIPITPQKETPESITFGSIKLSFTPKAENLSTSSDSKSKKTLNQTPFQIIATITNLDNEIVVNNERYTLTNFNNSFITSAIQLPLGDYKLTGFNVVNSDNEIIFSAPLAGSEFADLVNTPLPISFSISENNNNDNPVTLSPEVLNVEDEDTPEQFGYLSFSFDVIETQDIFVLIQNSGNSDSGTLTITSTPDGKDFIVRDLTIGINRIKLPFFDDTNTVTFTVSSAANPNLTKDFSFTKDQLIDANYNQGNPLLVLLGNIPLDPQFTVEILNFDNLNTEIGTFNEAMYEVVDNPFLTGVNNGASQVGKVTNTGIQEFEGIVSTALPIVIDFSATSSKRILVDVYSETTVPVDFQVKRVIPNNDNTIPLPLESPRGAGKTVIHNGTGWEQLEFNYNEEAFKTFDGFADDGDGFTPDGIFNQIAMIIDGQGVATGTYYFDNIRLITSEETIVDDNIILNFDDLRTDFTGFDGVNYSSAVNPFLSGANNSASNVGQIIDTGNGPGEFSGAFSNVLTTEIDFTSTSSKTILVQVYSETSVPVDFQIKRVNANLEILDSPRGAGKTITHNGTGWEELEFDFNVGAIKSFTEGATDNFEPIIPEGIFNQILMIIDGPGAAPGTYYIDNIKLKK